MGHSCPECGQACYCGGEIRRRPAITFLSCGHCLPKPADAEDEQEEPAPDLGACCCCGKAGPDVRNLLALPYRAPVDGTGWGCARCGLPADGALAVVCDACQASKQSTDLKAVIYGPWADRRRTYFAEVAKGPRFEHDRDKHYNYFKFSPNLQQGS